MAVQLYTTLVMYLVDLFCRNAVQYIGTLSVCSPKISCGHVLIKTLVLLINATKAVGMKDFVGM